MRKVSSQIVDKVIYEKFHPIRPNGAEMNGCDRQIDRQTDTHKHTHTDTQTDRRTDRPRPRC